VNHPGKALFDVIQLGGAAQTLWPVHCVQNTRGAELAAGLDRDRIQKVFPKGTDPMVDSYSGFFDNGHHRSTGMGEWLRTRGVREVFVGGLATDYCVKFTALDAVKLGFQTHLIEDACRGVNLKSGDVADAITQLRGAQVAVVRRAELALFPVV
jgi:nicotinamidase/pyrazinamidase